jgi:hypothetical protein
MEIDSRDETKQVRLYKLDKTMRAFMDSYQNAFINHLSLHTSIFINMTMDELRNETWRYLDRHKNRTPGVDEYFNRLGGLAEIYIGASRYKEAELFWEMIRSLVSAWEVRNAPHRIHKGALYFFWCKAVLLEGDLDKAFLLIHSALHEDYLTHNQNPVGTPAYLTATFNFEDRANLLYEEVHKWSIFVESLLEEFRMIAGINLMLPEFRAKLLNSHPSLDMIIMLTHAIAKLVHLDEVPVESIQGEFASIYELTLLHDVILVIDSLLFRKIIPVESENPGFMKLINYLLRCSNISNDEKENKEMLKNVNAMQRKNSLETMERFLDRKYEWRNKIITHPLESDIGLIYCIRNYSSHNLEATPLIRDRFSEIRQSVFNVLFLAVYFA